MRDTRALRCVLASAVLVTMTSATVAGCATAEAGAGRYGVTQRAPVPLLRASVPAGAEAIGVAAPLVVSAVGGTLTTVTVTGGGRPLPGTLSADRTRWTSRALSYNTLYTVTATGMGSEGRPIPALSSVFRTVKPARTLEVDAVRPGNGQTVGVAMPISIYFNHPVRDKAAVERRLAVVPTAPTEGSFNWVADDQVNWRPKEFWAPGTTVTVRSTLRGLDAGAGTFGAADEVSAFTVGRRQEAVGDVNRHTLTLFSDGKPVRTMPASFGRAQYPTQSGVHVAFEKHATKRMRSASWGGPREGEPGFYDQVLPLAVRISANGEFVHVNGATVRDQGRRNVSHGCVNLSPANGRAFYDWVQIGDPVNIVGSAKPLTRGDGDISDWLVPWDRYTAGSALRLPLLGDPPAPAAPLNPLTE